MAELQCAAGILVHENALNNHDIGPVLQHDTADRVEYLAQPIGERAIHTRHRAAGHVGGRIAAEIKHAEARQARARIDSQYELALSQLPASICASTSSLISALL